MKSRYLILVPIILLALFLIPLILLRNEIVERPATPPQTTEATPPPAATPPPLPEPPPYTTAPPSPDGIGKIFMGREISHVMGHPGIGWLERTEREKEEAPSKAIALLDLAPDTVIADIGAGSGYYTFRIAPLVPEGKVIAIDIQQEMLDFLKNEAARQNIGNVEPHLGTIESINLPPETLDAALMVDAYHEFSHPAEMLRSLHKALKPGGKIYLLEYRAEDPEVPIKTLHKMSAAQAIKEFEALDFTFLENKPDLPWQHLFVFEKSQTSTSNSQTSRYITEKLESIRMPKVRFEEATVEEAMDFLRLKAMDSGSAEKKGISMIIRRPRETSGPNDQKRVPLDPPSPEDLPRISLDLYDATFREVLEAIAEQAVLDIHLTTHGLQITPAGSIPSTSSDPEILSTIYRHSPKPKSPADH